VERKADTCDSEDLPITGVKQNLICASGDTDSSGSPQYHGLQRDKALVNFVIDEDLLIVRHLKLPSSVKKSEIVPGLVTAYDDPETANATFPVDFQMPEIVLDSSEHTAYRCVIFNMPLHLKVVSWESVWGNGVTIEDGYQPVWLHHQSLSYCESPNEKFSEEQLSGKPFDCYSKMPSCDTQIVHGQNGIIDLPSASHLPLQGGGVYMLLIHIENPQELQLGKTRPGIRVWTEPLQVPATSQPGRLLRYSAHFDSINIPPGAEPYEMSFMISAEATKAVLPEAGLQVAASTIHMHQAGIRANVQLIRDGVHVANVYETKGFDFAMQTPKYDLWKLLPGDALIVSCSFKPDMNRNILGGWGTDDEMVC